MKLLIICGPTATGKTNTGLKLAKHFNGEIISADSRQVYNKMDIGTGKDIPSGFSKKDSPIKYQGKKLHFYKNHTTIWGYDLVEPDEEFSVAHFKKIAQKIIKDVIKRNKIPIIVGGTGFYLKSLTYNLDTIGIPPDNKLRKELLSYSIQELQNRLRNINQKYFNKMNHSDKNNPRRLIRAIEVSLHKRKQEAITKINNIDSLWLGLSAPEKILVQKINKRVDQRIKGGALDEVKQLLKNGYDFILPSMSAIGYKEWKDYLRGKMLKNEVILNWKQNEKKYAKRQMTWFKKQPDIHWFDVSKSNSYSNVVDLVTRWYS